MYLVKTLPGCKRDNKLETNVVYDSVHFLIDDTNSKWDITIAYNGEEMCSNTWKFGDSGVYTIVIKETEDKVAAAANAKKIKYECYFTNSVEPSDYWKPIWLFFVFLVVLIILVMILVIVKRRFPMLKEEILKKLGRWNPEDEVK
jgi:hypothetical protein